MDAYVVSGENELRELIEFLKRPAIRKIVRHLISKPNMTSHIMEISRETGYHKSTVSIYVKLLERKGLVETWTEPVHEGYNIVVEYKKVRLRKIVYKGEVVDVGKII